MSINKAGVAEEAGVTGVTGVTGVDGVAREAGVAGVAGVAREAGVAGVAGVAREAGVARKGLWIEKKGNSELLITTLYIGETKLYEKTAYGKSNIKELLQKISWIEKNSDTFIESSTVIANDTKNFVMASLSFVVAAGTAIIDIAVHLKKIHDFLSKPSDIQVNYDDCDYEVGDDPNYGKNINEDEEKYFSCSDGEGEEKDNSCDQFDGECGCGGGGGGGGGGESSI
jgi:hypothetical protein